MVSRLAAGAVLSLSLAVLAGDQRTAFADEPPKGPDAAAPAPPKPAPPPLAPPKVEEPQGAILVAASDDAGPAARALALEVYREPLLRPRIDETTAQILAGGAPA